jgi:hypothetical protein
MFQIAATGEIRWEGRPSRKNRKSENLLELFLAASGVFLPLHQLS